MFGISLPLPCAGLRARISGSCLSPRGVLLFPPMSDDSTSYTIEIITIAVYLLFMVGVGLYMRRLSSDTSDFFRAGGKGTWWLVGGSVFMQSFSALTFTGIAGAAFVAGWSSLASFIAGFAGLVINFLVTAAWFRRTRAVTGVEVIRLRFGPVVEQLYGWAGVPLGILWTSVQLLGLSSFAAAVFDIHVVVFIVVIGTVVTTYAMFGGSWAVMSNDFLQTLILVPMTILVAFLALQYVGGIGGFSEAIAAEGLSSDFAFFNDFGHTFDTPVKVTMGFFTVGWFMAVFIGGVTERNSLNTAYRFLAAKTGKDARHAALLAGGLLITGAVIWMIPPMVARVAFAEEVLASPLSSPQDAAYAIASMKLLPAGLTGLILVAMFTATMSSMDSGLTNTSGNITRQLYPPLWRALGLIPKEGAALLMVGRALILVLGLIVIGLAWFFSTGGSIFSIMLKLGASLGIPMTLPLFYGLFFKVPNWGALVSLFSALAVSAYALFLHQPLFGEPMLYQHQVLWIFLAGTIGFFLSAAFWKFASDADRANTQRFFTLIRTPIDFTSEVGEQDDGRQLRTIGNLGAIIGALIMVLNVVPNTVAGHLTIAVLSLAVIGFGMLLFLLGRRQQRKAEMASQNPPSEE